MLIKNLWFLQAEVITKFEVHLQMLMTYLIPLGQSLLKKKKKSGNIYRCFSSVGENLKLGLMEKKKKIRLDRWQQALWLNVPHEVWYFYCFVVYLYPLFCIDFSRLKCFYFLDFSANVGYNLFSIFFPSSDYFSFFPAVMQNCR